MIEGPTLFSELELKARLESARPGNAGFLVQSCFRSFTGAVIGFPSALILARLAKEPRRSFCLPPLEPIYLREPHITMPK